MMSQENSVYEIALKEVGLAAGLVADFCDKTDHNESVQTEWVSAASEKLLNSALAIAEFERVELQQSYAQRLSQIERRNVIWGSSRFEGEGAALQARTMRDLQLVQLEHDRIYHPDVFGLKKEDQLRHYALHLSKLVAALVKAVQSDSGRTDFLQRRLADLLLFSIKLQTVMGRRMSENTGLAISRVEASVLG